MNSYSELFFQMAQSKKATVKDGDELIELMASAQAVIQQLKSSYTVDFDLKPFDINQIGPDGLTLLMTAAKYKNLVMAEWLVKKMADIDFVEPSDQKKRTALHFAIQSGSVLVASHLICQGASIYDKNTKKSKSLEMAVEHNQLGMTQFITQKILEKHLTGELPKNEYINILVSAIVVAIKNSRVEHYAHIFLLLKEHNANLKNISFGIHKYNLLHLAVLFNSHPEIISDLKKECPFLFRTPDGNGIFPLTHAVTSQNIAAVFLMTYSRHFPTVFLKWDEGVKTMEILSQALECYVELIKQKEISKTAEKIYYLLIRAGARVSQALFDLLLEKKNENYATRLFHYTLLADIRDQPNVDLRDDVEEHDSDSFSEIEENPYAKQLLAYMRDTDPTPGYVDKFAMKFIEIVTGDGLTRAEQIDYLCCASEERSVFKKKSKAVFQELARQIQEKMDKEVPVALKELYLSLREETLRSDPEKSKEMKQEQTASHKTGVFSEFLFAAFHQLHQSNGSRFCQLITDLSAMINGNEALRFTRLASRYLPDVRNEWFLDLNDTHLDRETLLSLAVDRNASASTKFLLSSDVDVDCVLKEGETPFLRAIRKGNEFFIRLLHQHGANPHAVNDSGQNALMITIEEGHSHLLNLLVETYHIDTQHRDNEGFSVIDYAVDEDKFRFVQALNIDPIICMRSAIEMDSPHIFKKLRKAHPNLFSNVTLLTYQAIKHDASEILRTIFNKHLDQINREFVDDQKFGFLHWASQSSLSVFRTTLRCGVPFHITDCWNDTIYDRLVGLIHNKVKEKGGFQIKRAVRILSKGREQAQASFFHDKDYYSSEYLIEQACKFLSHHHDERKQLTFLITLFMHEEPDMPLICSEATMHRLVPLRHFIGAAMIQMLENPSRLKAEKSDSEETDEEQNDSPAELANIFLSKLDGPFSLGKVLDHHEYVPDALLDIEFIRMLFRSVTYKKIKGIVEKYDEKSSEQREKPDKKDSVKKPKKDDSTPLKTYTYTRK